MASELSTKDKVSQPRNYKGIAFVHMHDLSPPQIEKMKETLSDGDFIKILINGQVLKQCLQYHDYLKWYNHTYMPVTEGAAI